MTAPFSPPSLGTMLARALILHCPRCGAGHLFVRWLHMVERCPACRFRFVRKEEDGSFLGAYVLNLAVTEGALALVLLGFVIFRANSDGGGPLWPVFALGGLVAILLPLAFYPFSRTLWTAIDLAARPPNAEEL